jgi:HAD superfamily, subfamily IIIB (Acid phosphatase)
MESIVAAKTRTLAVFDLDGTLVDNDARKGTDTYMDPELLANDPVIRPIAAKLRNLRSTGADIVLLTGRDEQFREPTIDWLRRNRLSGIELFMRPTGMPWQVLNKYKAQKIAKLAREGKYDHVIFYDDNAGTVTVVYRTLASLDVTCELYQVKGGQVVREEIIE